MSDNMNRRDFLGMAFGGFAAIGIGASLFAMKRTWDPLPSVISAGFTEADISAVEPGAIRTVAWRGKPVYVLHKTADMTCSERDVVIEGKHYSIGIQICTHLGCIPSWQPDRKIFKCACHGGEFDACGTNTFGPPPRPFDIPPFSIKGTTVVFGEEGPEYKKIAGLA